jgi:signal transduction histidine kinase
VLCKAAELTALLAAWCCARELAETILDSGDTLLTILGDILDFSKIDHNSMVLESTPVDLRLTIEATIEMVAVDAVKKGLEIAYILDPRLRNRKVLGDAIRIRQVRNRKVLGDAIRIRLVRMRQADLQSGKAGPAVGC